MKIFKEQYGATGTGSVGGDGVTFSSGLPTTRLRNKKGQVIGPVGEEIVNSAGGGSAGPQIASIGQDNPSKGPRFGEPGVPKRHQPKENKSVKNGLWENNPVMGDMVRRSDPSLTGGPTFAGARIFEVSPAVFHNLTMQKRKGKHWRTYLEEDDCFEEIREFAKKNRGAPIIAKNSRTDEMRYVRYGKKG